MEQNKATRWEINDLRLFKNLYNTVPVHKLANQLGKTQNALYCMAFKLGMRRPKKEKLVQCFVTVKGKHALEAKSLINKTIKKWR